jgi:15-cis-phytoene synthase
MDSKISPIAKGTQMEAANITRQSKSNLALAFISLGRERKRDINIFYAFCRVVDDIADSSKLEVAEKRQRLMAWREMLRSAMPGEPALAHEVRCLIDKYSLSIEISRYATFEELRVYCYRVASVVGLVSIEIFGYRNPACKEYALQLGLALQMTNIIRDVGKDLRNGRIYLPHEDLARYEYSEAELKDRQYNERFVRLMEFEAQRARQFFSSAAASLPPEDRRSMVAAEIMSSVYRGLLRRMELDKFHVFEKEYRLSKLEKASRIAAQLLRRF